MDLAIDLDALEAQIDRLPKKARKKLEKLAARELAQPWIPQPGPQTDALKSQADILLYGGAAGGGKTDLIIGLGLREHTRVGIFRQQAGELAGMIDRLNEILDEKGLGAVTGNPPKWNGPDGKKFEFGHLEKPRAEKSWQGRPHDLKAFDEAAQINPQKIIYVMGWARTSKEGQHCRTVLCSNPPIGGEGDYLVEWFGPWLDPTHALYGTVGPGELLWAVFAGSGDNIRTVWVDGPEQVEIEGQLRTPKSRTFIPARLSDNLYYGEEYRAQIDAMPEPMRSALLNGDFMVAQEDHRMQVIPTEHIRLAVERYKARWKSSLKMEHMGVDIAQGGADNHVIAPLHERNCFNDLVITPGKDVPDGRTSVNIILANRRNEASITVDMTGGWGGSTSELILADHDIEICPFVASEVSGGTTRDGSLSFVNDRAEMWWQFREALDPDNNSEEDMPAIPPDQALQRELAMVRWEPRSGGKIIVESKDDIRARLGRSTDRADAVLMAWKNRHMKTLRKLNRAEDRKQSTDLRDPLQGWTRNDQRGARRGKVMANPLR